MAVTNTGLRLFFTSSVGDLSRPLTLQHLVDSPREPPFNFIRRSITSPGHQPFNQQEIGVTFYHHNVFLLAKPLPEADSIITVSTDLRSNFRS